MDNYTVVIDLLRSLLFRKGNKQAFPDITSQNKMFSQLNNFKLSKYFYARDKANEFNLQL